MECCLLIVGTECANLAGRAGAELSLRLLSASKQSM
jgi:hypothetical protein